MIQATDNNPILSRPHTLRGRGRVRLTGAGELVVRLDGRGHATIRRGPSDTARFAGAGRLRHLSSERLEITAATGHLLLEGSHLELEFDGGPVEVSVRGRFAVDAEGVGRVETARGERLHWGSRPACFRLDGPRVVLAAG